MSQVLLFLFFSGSHSLSLGYPQKKKRYQEGSLHVRYVEAKRNRKEGEEGKERDRESIKAKGKMEIDRRERERESAIAADGPDATNGRSRWAWLPCGCIQPARSHIHVRQYVHTELAGAPSAKEEGHTSEQEKKKRRERNTTDFCADTKENNTFPSTNTNLPFPRFSPFPSCLSYIKTIRYALHYLLLLLLTFRKNIIIKKTISYYTVSMDCDVL